MTDAGWYDDPNDRTKWRFWDGERWTDDYADRPPEPERKSSTGLVVAGWVCALFLPVVGLVIGVLIWGSGDDEGLVIAGASLIVGVLAALLLVV
jgi:hypothetical protein